jgi:hypothetical protein
MLGMKAQLWDDRNERMTFFPHLAQDTAVCHVWMIHGFLFQGILNLHMLDKS